MPGMRQTDEEERPDHRGLPEEHMRCACEWLCYMKSGSPNPASLIRTGSRNATGTAKPSGDDNGDDGEPGYGTGADWDEFHTHVKWNQTD